MKNKEERITIPIKFPTFKGDAVEQDAQLTDLLLESQPQGYEVDWFWTAWPENQKGETLVPYKEVA